MVSFTPNPRVGDYVKYGAVRNIANAHKFSGLPNYPATASEETLPLLMLVQVDVGDKLKYDPFWGKIP